MGLIFVREKHFFLPGQIATADSSICRAIFMAICRAIVQQQSTTFVTHGRQLVGISSSFTLQFRDNLRNNFSTSIFDFQFSFATMQLVWHDPYCAMIGRCLTSQSLSVASIVARQELRTCGAMENLLLRPDSAVPIWEESYKLK